MATKYDRRIEKLQGQFGEPLHKVWVDYDAAETERERARFLAATRGRGSFIVIDQAMAGI